MIHKDDYFSEHISKRYNDELSSLFDEAVQMGTLVEQQLEHALQAFFGKDHHLASQTIEKDQQVNQSELKIHEKCVEVLARRQPAASDLRLVISILSFSREIERIGDLAKKIAKYTRFLDESPVPDCAIVQGLAKLTQNNLSKALTAFVRLDQAEALRTIEQDRRINAEQESLYRQLLTYMMENPATITRSIQIHTVTTTLERIGDHAKNIGESVVYLVSGEDIRYQDLDAIRERFDGE